MIELRPFDSLGAANHGWLNARHHFAFASYHDPKRMSHGSLRVWNDQVSLSTLTVTLSTRQPEIAAAPVTDPSFGQRVSIAWHDSIGALGAAAEGLSIALIALLPWLPLLAPLVYFGIRFIRRRGLLPRAVAYVPMAYAPPPPPPTDAVPPPPAA